MIPRGESLRSDDNGTWHSIQEAAVLLNLHPSTVRKRLKRGEIPSREIELSGRMVYEVQVLEGEAIEEEAVRLQVELGRAEALRDQAQEESARLRTAVADIEAELRPLNEAFATVQATLAVREADHAGDVERIQQLLTEKTGLQLQLDAAAVDYQELEARHTSTRALLDAAREHYAGRGIRAWFRRRFRRFDFAAAVDVDGSRN